MKQNLIFVFLLLATLLMVNAIPTQLNKRATVFRPCAKTPLDVIVEPDPPVSGAKAKYYVSGTLKRTIHHNYVLAVLYLDISTDPPKLIDIRGAYICEPDGVLDCPYPANTPIDVILSTKVPPALPKTYGIAVAIGNEKLDIVLGCATAVVGGTPGFALTLPAIQMSFDPAINMSSIEAK